MRTPKSTNLRLSSSQTSQAIQVQFKLTSQLLWEKMVDAVGIFLGALSRHINCQETLEI